MCHDDHRGKNSYMGELKRGGILALPVGNPGETA
jgi:hypothetical protein